MRPRNPARRINPASLAPMMAAVRFAASPIPARRDPATLPARFPDPVRRVYLAWLWAPDRSSSRAAPTPRRARLRCRREFRGHWPRPLTTSTFAEISMSIRHSRAGLPGLAVARSSRAKAPPTKSSATASFLRRSASTIPASTMSCRSHRLRASRPATIRRSGSAIFPANFPSGSPRLSRFRSAQPTAASSARRTDRDWEPTDFRI